MTIFTITVKDEGVQTALKALALRVNNMKPVLQTLGVGITERAQQRFDNSTGPDGVKWKRLSDVTLGIFKERLAGKKSNVKKNGALNAKGLRELINRRPLIDSGQLQEQIEPHATASGLTVVANTEYAAIHQFGGKAGRGLKVTIPARPFLPVRADGTLYPQEQVLILEAINRYLIDGL